MKRKNRFYVFVFSGLFLLMIIQQCAPRSVDPFKQVERMKRGVNIIGYDPIWQDFHKKRFQEKHFQLIKQGGFQTVRINLHAFQHMDTTRNNQLEPTWFKTLDWAVDHALANDLYVILDLHNFIEFARHPEKYESRFFDFWRQVAQHYKDAPDRVIFEILNEPNGGVTPDVWNRYAAEALKIIRATNPVRTVIVGPPFWNTIDHLNNLILPEEDRNIIVTVHYYLPMKFTHQGAPWAGDLVNVSGVTWGTDEEKHQVIADFGRANEWAHLHNRPILLGEFGAYDKGDIDSRVRYTSHIARTAESLGWAWTYWQFDSDFIVYDIDKDQWNEPIHNALVP